VVRPPPAGPSGNTESRPKVCGQILERLPPSEATGASKFASGTGQGCGTRTRNKARVRNPDKARTGNGAGPEQDMQGAGPEKQTQQGCKTNTARVRSRADRGTLNRGDSQIQQEE